MKKLLFLGYAFLLILLTCFSYAFIDQNLIYFHWFYSSFAFSHRIITTIVYLLFLLLLFAFYIEFLLLANRKELNLKEIKILIGISIVTLFFSYPAMLSYDIFNYIATAKVLFHYRENPYIIMPIEFRGDSLLLFTHAANKTALYGPFWIVLTCFPFIIGFGNFIATLFSFKLFTLFFYLAIIIFLWKTSKSIFSLVFFALNPLVIIETLVGSHNDVVMMFFSLLSFLLVAKRKYFLASIFLILSILIKYATIFLVPVFLYSLINTVRKKQIQWQKIYVYSFLSMFLIFFLSSLREEIYPWYAIWFISFASLIPKERLLVFVSLIFSFSLMLRYIPFMLLGTYFGVVPVLKIFVTFIPLAIFLVGYIATRTFPKL